MQRKNTALGLTIGISLGLTACGTQPPVKVVDGFGTYNREAVTYSKTDEFVMDVVESSDLPATPVAPKAKTYTVQQGDKLSQIAAFFHVDEDELLSHNMLITEAQVKPGTVLNIPNLEEKSSNNALSVDSMLDAKADDANTTTYRLTDRFKKPAQPVEIPDEIMKHTVQAGENIYRIGLKYNVSQFDIINANDGVDPSDLKIGQQLVIPMKGSQAPKKVEMAEKAIQQPSQPAVTAKTAPKQLTTADYKKLVQNAPKVSIPSRGMMWPAKGSLLKTYGNKERGVTHTGINISLAENTPIRAVDGGKVIYSDNGLEQYGNLILIRHNNGYVTAYAHNNFNNVKRNQWVKKGDVIALAGNTGLVDKTQLHFEVRKNAQAINPLKVLPK